METSDHPKKRHWFRWALRGLGLSVLVGFFAGLTAPLVLRSYRDPKLGDWHSLTNLRYGIQGYASENDGLLPDRLEDLDVFSGQWDYFPGFAASDPPDTILVASSETFSKSDGTSMVGEGPHRMVLSLGGRKFILKEADYQACIREQQQPAWKRKEAGEAADIWGFLSEPAWHEANESVLDTEHDPREIPKLIRSLTRGNSISRSDAADALCELVPITPEVVPAFLEALSNPESGYDAAMGLAVMSLKDESVVPKLIEVLRNGAGKATYWAAVSLEDIGLENAKDAIPLMVAKLESEGDIKVTAAKALAGAGADAAEAVPALIKLMAHGDSWECKCSVIALGRIGPQAHDALVPLGAMFDSSHDYRIDVARSLWKISPAQARRVIPALIAELENQRIPNGPNNPMNHGFFSAIELLGEIGPEAKDAIPILRANLNGGASFDAAWALWRIDPALLKEVAPILTQMMGTTTAQPNRLDRLARGSKLVRIDFGYGNRSFNCSVSSRMSALGALWHMYPERREALSPLLVTLIREWEQEKVLNKLSHETRTAIPALESLLENQNHSALHFPAREALQKIKTTDPGGW